MQADEKITMIQSDSSHPYQDLAIFNFWSWDCHEIEGMIDRSRFITGRAIDAFNGDCFMHRGICLINDALFIFMQTFNSDDVSLSDSRDTSMRS